MVHRLHIPRSSLSEVVECFSYSESNGRAPSLLWHLPTGAAELIFNLSQHSPQALVCGPFSKPFAIGKPPSSALLTVQFKSGGAFPFFKVPTDELHNLHVPLADLWRTKALELCERLFATPDIEAKFQLLEQFLWQQAANPRRKSPAVQWAMQKLQEVEPPVRLAAIADETGYSQRHFIQLFRHQVGLTPKVFLRLQRFWRVVQVAQAHDEVNWADLALACGYYDQAHFIHEFRTFAGLTPSDWLRAHDASSPHILARN